MQLQPIPEDLLGTVLVPKKLIIERENTLAEQIYQDNIKSFPVLLCVKEGAKYFFNDLCDLLSSKKLKFDKAWISTSSYEKGESTGDVKISEYTGPDLKGRKVIIIEDIIDTALTIKRLVTHLESQGISLYEVAVLLFKKRPQNLVWRLFGLRACFGMPRIKYVGFQIPKKFVVGKGLDYENFGRKGEEIRVLTQKGQYWVDEQKGKESG